MSKPTPVAYVRRVALKLEGSKEPLTFALLGDKQDDVFDEVLLQAGTPVYTSVPVKKGLFCSTEDVKNAIVAIEGD